MNSRGFESRSLLLVEDEAEVRGTLNDVLSVEGFHVTGCSNGREALDWLKHSPKPDLILLDLMMPVMDGWQFRVAQKGDPELAKIPVLALTANGTANAAAIDAEGYLKKPVDYETLVATIDRLLVASEHRDLQARLAQTDRLTSLGTLAAGVAHEINNPLAYVLLNLSHVRDELPRLLAEEERTSNRALDAMCALDHALTGVGRIRDIVRGLKTFSRSESETRGPVVISEVLDATLAMIAHEVSYRAHLVKDYAAIPNVLGSEARLGQVFLNLLLNAAQSLPDGRVDSNEIRIVVRSASPESVAIEIHDTGAGIPAAVRGRIFEPFFTTKPVGVGTGLGLAICHGIVTSLGGTLSFESEVGKGSVFRVELPVVPPSIEPRGSGVAPASVPPLSLSSGLSRGRVLIVDDDPIVCSSLERLIARLLSDDAEVISVNDARDGLAMIERGEEFDVILCDVMMRTMDGPALYTEVRKVSPLQARRMVFMTSGIFTARAREFLAGVPNARMCKPFDVSVLRKLLMTRLGYTAH